MAQSSGLQRAAEANQQGQFEKAESTLRGVLRTQPDSLPANQMLGVVLEQEEKFQEAEQILQKAAKLSDGKDPQILLALCRAEFALRKKSEAQALAGQVAARADDSTQLHYALGALLRENGLAEGAVQELQTARALAPGNPAVVTELVVAELDLGRGQAAADQLAKLLESASYEDLLSAGARFGETGKNDAAVQTLERAVQLKPDSYNAVFNLAFAYYHQGKPEQTLVALNNIPSTEASGQADYHYLRGKAEAALHQDREAGEEFLKALQIEPGNESLCSDAGLLFFHFENFWKALDLYQRCSERLPDSMPVETGLGLTYFRLGKYDDATRTFAKVLALRPDADAAREALVFLDYVSGRLPDARRLVEERLRTPGADYYLYYLNALVLLRLAPSGDHREPMNALNEAARLNPRFAPVYFQRAKLCDEAHDDARALADLAAATRLDNTYAEPFSLMAQIDYKLGRMGEAAQAQREYTLRVHEREEKEQDQLVENRLLQAIQ